MPTDRRPDAVGRSTVHVVGRGVVGGRLVKLLGADHDLVVADPEAADHGVPQIVVLARPGPNPESVAEWIDAGASVVTMSGGVDDLRQVFDLDDRARRAGVTVLAGAAASPGLTGLLARHAMDRVRRVEELHVAVHGTAGPACAHEHHRTLRGWAVGRTDGHWTERRSGGGRELCWFPEPVGAWDCYVGDLADGLALPRGFPDIGRISVRRSATRRDRLTARLPMLSPPHREGGVGAVRVEARGADASGRRLTVVLGVAERIGSIAAAVAAAAVEAIADEAVPTGVVVAGQRDLPTNRLLSAVARHGIRLQIFEGEAAA